MYKSLRACVDDLERNGHLIRIEQELDADQEIAEIHRRVFQAGGPALYFANVKGCRFPMVSNLFGTRDRMHFIFRHTIKAVKRIINLKVDPMQYMHRPWEYCLAARSALWMLPRPAFSGPVLKHETTIDQLPQLKSWPMDGGGFVTLPQVYTEDPDKPGLFKSNLGMYRVQLTGNEFETNKEIGMHYQIHRGIGVHHTHAIRKGEPLKCNVFVGGPPSMSVAAVMPLPEGLPELFFAGGLGGRPLPIHFPKGGLPIPTNLDFCITGTIDLHERKPEGPFGDHLGYYSLTHDFPVMKVDKVYHRPDAIWPFTVVGRPPQEDTMFGELIHDITGPVLPTVLPGIHGVHAVDAAGVHPLLLAIGSERYVPYETVKRPQELLTQANAILGQGQLSLAKYLFIVNHHDDTALDIHDIEAFLCHLLKRVDWTHDLHFQTCTTIDTLDYTGTGINEGSKLVVAAVGEPRRELPTTVPGDLNLPEGFSNPHVCIPGVLAVQAPKQSTDDGVASRFCEQLDEHNPINRFPLILLVDDSEFAARTLNNMLWVTFTRSNPAVDVYGIASGTEYKHWGCRGSLVIDARYKSHQAPPLLEDPDVVKKVDDLAAKGGPLHGII